MFHFHGLPQSDLQELDLAPRRDPSMHCFGTKRFFLSSHLIGVVVAHEGLGRLDGVGNGVFRSMSYPGYLSKVNLTISDGQVYIRDTTKGQHLQSS